MTRHFRISLLCSVRTWAAPLGAVLVSSLMVAMVPLPAMAGTVTWDGDAGDGLWSNRFNWSGDTLPAFDDDVTIDGNAGTVHLDIDVIRDGLTTIGSTSSTDHDTLIVDSGVKMTIVGEALNSGGGDRNDVVVRRSGTLLNYGWIAEGTGSLADVTVNSGGYFTNNGVVSDVQVQAYSGGLVTNNGELGDQSSARVQGGTFDNNGLFRPARLFIDNDGVVNNASGSAMYFTGSQFNDLWVRSGSLNNYGVISSTNPVRNAGTIDNFGTLYSTATIENQGTLIEECGSTLVGTVTGNSPVVESCDTTPPTVTVPADIVTDATSPTGAIVTFSVAATDDVGVVSLVCAPASGSVFPLGITTVTCTAADAAGNTASASFDVTVNNVPPVANDDAAATNEDTPVIVDVLANDSDPNGDVLSVAGVLSNPTNGTASVNPDGTITYTPALNFYGVDGFTYQVTDPNGGTSAATMTIQVLPVNDPPVASDDSVVTDEDTPVIVDVLANDSDLDGDLLSVNQVVSGPSNGTTTVNTDGTITYKPAANFNGSDSFVYEAGDGNGGVATATVYITVNPVNDAAVVSVDLANQSVQYSDGISAVTISASDIDSTSLSLTPSGLPAGTSVGTASCTPAGLGTACTWQLSGYVTAGQGTYTPSFSVDDGEDSSSVPTVITVLREDATLVVSDDNPVAVEVDSQGSDSSLAFELSVSGFETSPDAADSGDPAAGNISLADIQIMLVPVGPGGTVSPTGCSASMEGSGYAGVKTVTCTFDDAPVNTYTVETRTVDDFYVGATEDVLTVFDPSLGFTTGGGSFYWPSTGEKTNFGYTMKYNKKGQRVQGSLLMIRHLPDDTKYRIKSNSLEGLALGEDPSVPYGWASFSGKSTYLEPHWVEAEGNHSFTVYVEDHNDPDSGIDSIWIEIRDKDGHVIPDMSLPESAAANSVPISGGDIVVPYSSSNGSGGRR